jgi:hypothetical protein
MTKAHMSSRLAKVASYLINITIPTHNRSIIVCAPNKRGFLLKNFTVKLPRNAPKNPQRPMI